jgi:hypothetical protein
MKSNSYGRRIARIEKCGEKAEEGIFPCINTRGKECIERGLSEKESFGEVPYESTSHMMRKL